KPMNEAFGSERGPELLPYLTSHEIPVGGITHSANFAGIGYFLQCFMSDDCAGWPTGSAMPEKDIPRGIDMMKALGVPYHIAVSTENRKVLDHLPQVTKLYEGRTLALYKLKEPVHLVEVFSDPLPVFTSTQYRTLLLNLPRWDVMRNTGIIFRSAPPSP